MTTPAPARKTLLIAAVALLGCLVIAVPTALFFGLGDLVLGGDGASALSTVLFMAVGLAVLWTAQFAWESRRRGRRGGGSRPGGYGSRGS